MMAGSSEKDVSIQYVDVTTIDAVKAAHQASVEEHEQTFVEAIKSNHKSVLWSIAISLTIIMEGYDTGACILCCNTLTTTRLAANIKDPSTG